MKYIIVLFLSFNVLQGNVFGQPSASHSPTYHLSHHNTFTPTGKIGTTYYQNTLLFINTLNIKIDNNFSIGIGEFPLLGPNFEGIYLWISPKLSIPLKSDNLHLSIGYYGGYTPSFGFSGNSIASYLGALYGVITYEKGPFTGSVGVGYGMGNGSLFKAPFYSINLQYQLGARSLLLVETLSNGHNQTFSILCLRKLVSKKIWDFGWLFPVKSDLKLLDIGQNLNLSYGGPYISLILPFSIRGK